MAVHPWAPPIEDPPFAEFALVLVLVRMLLLLLILACSRSASGVHAGPLDVRRRDVAARVSDPINVELLGLTGWNVSVAGVPA